jgi:hypothetical protein
LCINVDDTPKTFSGALEMLKNKVLDIYSKVTTAKSQFAATHEAHCKPIDGSINAKEFKKLVDALIGEPRIYSYYNNTLVLRHDETPLLQIKRAQVPRFATNKPTYYTGTDALAFHVFVTFVGGSAVVTRISSRRENTGTGFVLLDKEIVSVTVHSEDEYESRLPFEQESDTVFILIAKLMDIYAYSNLPVSDTAEVERQAVQ